MSNVKRRDSLPFKVSYQEKKSRDVYRYEVNDSQNYDEIQPVNGYQGRRKDGHGTTTRKKTEKCSTSDIALVLSNLAKQDVNDIIISAQDSNLLNLLHEECSSMEFYHLPDLFTILYKICSNSTAVAQQEFIENFTAGPFFKERLATMFEETFLIFIADKNFNDFLMKLFFVLNNFYDVLERGKQTDCEKLNYLTETVSRSFLSLCSDQIDSNVEKAHNDLMDRYKLETLMQSFSTLNLTTTTETQQNMNNSILKFENTKPPNDFRELTVIPNAEELFHDSSNVFLRANKVRGEYKSANDYLDIQFRLMREDFLSPLRDGIKEVLALSSMPPVTKEPKLVNVRLYFNVQVMLSIPMKTSGIVHKISFRNHPWINWDEGKRLIYGSLLCFSSDNFKTIYLAIVCEREVTTLTRGYFYAKFINENAIPPSDASYIMLESVAYFEAYRHVLERLKTIKCNNFPFYKYLVKSRSDVVALPSYLTSAIKELKYDLRVIADKTCTITTVKRTNYIVCPSRGNTHWPNRQSIGLDDSQMQALKSALTSELVLIQGPPGTGKTYIGLKIFKILSTCVQQKIPNFGPILVVCYTNHALDQFLEGIHDFLSAPGSIVRIGSRTESDKMKACSIYNLKQQLKAKKLISRDIFRPMQRVNEELDNLESEILFSRREIRRAFTSILEFDRLSAYMSRSHKNSLQTMPATSTKLHQRPSLRSWLLNNCNNDDDDDDKRNSGRDSNNNNTMRGAVTTPGQNQWTGLRQFVNAKDETFCETRRRMLDDDGYIDITAESFTRLINESFDNFEDDSSKDCSIVDSGNWLTIQRNNQTHFIKEKLNQRDTLKMDEREVKSVSNVWLLNVDDRWRLYFYWVSKYLEKLENACSVKEKQFDSLSQERKELRFNEDINIMRRCKVIGMTTTGAARYGRALADLGCKIIVVEEAAEVLESHIITSLNNNCQHLILIGDHKQLKPSPSVYLLAKHYNLDVSLFERLINNGLHHDTLQHQHRMRPEIADVMRFIYPNLRDHDSVLTYPNIRGVASNLYFLDHDQKEKASKDSTSHYNPFEAEFAVALCRHFLKNGYNPSDITILTLYSAQLYHIKSKMQSTEFENVSLTSVDNFQGEENEIIILSLVRSNAKDYIGFLAVENRVCVALSRARNGLYIIGNSSSLSRNSKSKLWHNIVQHMSERKQLGQSLPLTCQIHRTKPPVMASSADDFSVVPDGGCPNKCLKILDCGHACRLHCHPVDQEHAEYKCLFRCGRIKQCGHPCNKLCHLPCDPCEVFVQKVISSCQHEQTMPCHVDPETFRCQFPVSKTFPQCLHQQLMPCSVSPNRFLCETPCERILPCGHRCSKLCGEVCPEFCGRPFRQKLQFCGHKIEVNCGTHPDCYLCPMPCGRLMLCGHKCRLTCGECFNGRLHGLCKEKCERVLLCGHKCQSLCYEACPPCTSSCQNECSHRSCSDTCSHFCSGCKESCEVQCSHRKCDKYCDQICDDTMLCNKKCNVRLTCNRCNTIFSCIGMCGEKCPQFCPTCDETKLKSFLTDSSTPYERARFITLWSCEHTFEVNYLDQRIRINAGPVQIIACPKCATPIDSKSSFRYAKIVKMHRGILRVVKIEQNNLNSVDIRREKVQKIMKIFNTQEKKFRDMAAYFQILFSNNFTEEIITPLFSKSAVEILLAETSLKFYDALYKIYCQIRRSGIDYHTYRTFQYLLLWIEPSSRTFTEVEIRQALFELERLRLLVAVTNSTPRDRRFHHQALLDCRDEKQLRRIRSALRVKAATMVVHSVPTLHSDNWRICKRNHLYATNGWKNLSRQVECVRCLKLASYNS